MSKKQGFKKRFEFWLNYDKPDQIDLAAQIEEMKENRQFAPNVRDGLRLMHDLRNGNVDVLLALFPNIRRMLATDDTGNGGQGGNVELAEIIASGVAEGLARAQLPGDKGQVVYHAPLLQQRTGTPAGGQDDLSSITVKKTASDGQSSQNFLNSLMTLQS